MADARDKMASWRDDDNCHRPHSSPGSLTPVEFAGSDTAKLQTALNSHKE
ncbi:MAG: integrase core domain-containing protein [Planctomycetes bacterium]|nr:integrase core domain-containing protein [Planctomycetota bacterium]